MRTVVLSFVDNKEAEEFARTVQDVNGLEAMIVIPERVTLDAMIARPTLSCHCSGGRIRAGRHGAKIIRGWMPIEKFGWYVCERCKRPNRAVVDNFVSNMLNGCRDLLPRIIPGRERADKQDTSVREAVHRQRLRDSERM